MSAETGRLHDRLALVTGAGSGIGNAIAVSLAAEGADVVGTGTKQSSIDAINESLGDRGRGVLLDLGSDPAEIAGVLKEIVADDQKSREDAGVEAAKRAIGILVNNGGVKEDGPFGRMEDEAISKVLDVNVRGTMTVTREVVRAARKVEDLRVITIGSVAAGGHAMQANYAASKAALRGFMRSLPGEQGRFGAPHSATFNVVEPGLVDTAIIESIPEETMQKAIEQTPARRVGTPDEVARLVTFLALPESGYINGAVIPIDGGASAGIHL